MPLFNGIRKVVLRVTRQPRAYPRLMISEPVRLTTSYASEQPAILEDISAGGACIRTHLKLRPGESVGMLMSLGLNHRFDTRARVVYSSRSSTAYQSRYGLSFIAMPAEVRNDISDFVVEQKFGRQFGMRPFTTDRAAYRDGARNGEPE